MTHIAVGHADFRQDMRCNELFPGLSAHSFNDFAGDQVQDVIVRVGTPETLDERNELKTFGNFFAVVCRGRPPEQVTGAQTEPAPVHKEITDREFTCHIRVGELKPGKVADDRRVPFQLSVFHEYAQRCGCKGFCIGGDAKQRAVVHSSRFAQLANAVAFGNDHFAVLDDRQSDARDFKFFLHSLDVCVEILGRCLRSHAL